MIRRSPQLEGEAKQMEEEETHHHHPGEEEQINLVVVIDRQVKLMVILREMQS